MADKVRYGIRNAYYAKIESTGEDGAPTFATPVPLPGAVNLSLSAEGGLTNFYADDVVYFVTSANNGYSGDFEIAKIPDQFREDILGETASTTDNVLIEKAGVQPANFALLFEFETPSGKSIRNVLYNCTATRPSMEGATTTDSIEVQTETISITASPLTGSGMVKAKTTDTTTENIYNAWYTKVYIPTAEAGV